MKVEETPCPTCGELTLEVKPKLVAHPIGTFSLSGQTMKFSSHWEWRWECVHEGCNASGRAEGE